MIKTEKKKYKLLIVSLGAGLVQILPLVKHLKKENPRAVIHLLTNEKLNTETREIKEYVSKIYQNREHRTLLTRFKLGFIADFLFWAPIYYLSLKQYDIVNIHYARPNLLKVMPWLKKVAKSIIFSPWGSDVLRVSDFELDEMREIYGYATLVTYSPDSQLSEALIEKFNCKPEQLHPARFGADFFDYMNVAKPTMTEKDAKAKYGVEGRYVISCGYSTTPSHQHQDFVEAIHSIKKKLPKNLSLLFPFTYGCGTTQYINDVKNMCREYDIDAVFVEKYLDIEDLYLLRMAADIFVNIQTTDACASSVMQYFLFNKKIVQGSWLDYKYLQDFDKSFYYLVDDLKDLGQTILKAYHSDEAKIPEELKHQILDKGWNTVIKRWDEIFTNAAYPLCQK